MYIPTIGDLFMRIRIVINFGKEIVVRPVGFY